MEKSIKFAYFGGEPLAVPVLEELKAAGLMPALVVCNPDRPTGRNQELTSPPAKLWAQENDVEVFQPTDYKDEATKTKLTSSEWDVFAVVAYNFMLPKWLLEIPKHGTLNVHPSLLPALRGASPIRTAIKDNLPNDLGVTVMLIDEKMDHGPILEQEQFIPNVRKWPMPGPMLDGFLAKMGGRLLAEALPAWVADELSPQDQDHEMATYCSKLNKADSELPINPRKLPVGKFATITWHTILAFEGIGDTFFVHQDKRVKIKKAELTDGGSLRLLRVIPEGKKEMNFTDYLQTLK